MRVVLSRALGIHGREPLGCKQLACCIVHISRLMILDEEQHLGIQRFLLWPSLIAR